MSNQFMTSARRNIDPFSVSTVAWGTRGLGHTGTVNPWWYWSLGKPVRTIILNADVTFPRKQQTVKKDALKASSE